MTRGRFMVLYKGKAYMSLEFNGDMYPSGNGKFVYQLLKYVHSLNDFKAAVEYFDKKIFKYAEFDDIDVKELNELDIYELDFSKDYTSRFYSDYIYIKNMDSVTYEIINKGTGKKVKILPGDIQSWYFGIPEKIDEKMMEFTEKDEKVIGFKLNANKNSYENNEITTLARTLLNSLFIKLKDVMKEKYNKVQNATLQKHFIFFNDKFFTNTEYYFIYDDISIYWVGDMNTNFKITTSKDLKVDDIIKMYEECCESIK